MSPRYRIQARLAAIFVVLVCAPIVLGVWLLAQSATQTQQSSLDQRLVLDLQIAQRQLVRVSDGAAAHAAALARRRDVQRAVVRGDEAEIRRIEQSDPSIEIQLGDHPFTRARRVAALVRTSNLMNRGRLVGRLGVFVGFDSLLEGLGSPPSADTESGLVVVRNHRVVAGPSILRGSVVPDGPVTLARVGRDIRMVMASFGSSDGEALRLAAYAPAASVVSGQRRWQFIVAAIVLLVSAAGAMLLLSRSILRFISQLANAAEQADTDALTGLATRRSFRRQVDLELRRSARSGAAVAVILADLDFFKTVNDRFGHGAGDAVLVSFARSVQRALRDGDVAARYGGEEFSILLPAAELADAARVAERIRADFARTRTVIRDGSTVYATSSFGVAVFDATTRTIDDVLHAADNALYRAKAAGRDCVALADEVCAVQPEKEGAERDAS